MAIEYYKLISNLPRSLSSLFNGIPSWVGSKVIKPDEFGRMLNRAMKAGKKTEWLKKYEYHKETLSIIMLIYFMNKYFINAHRMIHETLNELKEIGIDKYQIGSTIFTQNSDIVIFIKDFSEKLRSAFRDDELISSYLNMPYGLEIISNYWKSYAQKDLYI